MSEAYERRKAKIAASPELTAKERERCREYAVKKRNENRDAYNAKMREWNAKNAARINAKRREKRANNPEYAEKQRQRDRARWNKRKDAKRNSDMLKKYGITSEQYKELYEKQDGKCCICGKHKPDSGRDGLAVDHCHTEGHVRGLLCPNCNMGLGSFFDNIETLQNAIKYLERK